MFGSQRNDLDRFLGKEVYILAESEDQEVQEISIHLSYESLVASLEKFDADTSGDMRILHGVLASAAFLPQKLAGKSAFIMVWSEEGNAIKDSSCQHTEELASELTRIMEEWPKVDIDDLFILYGYDIIPCLGINSEEIDEEAVARCMLLMEEVEDVASRALVMED
jgi:hypothetical protein